MSRFLPLAMICAFTSCVSPQPLHGTVFSPPQAAKRFSLTDQNGNRFILAQRRSNATALYFGFTNCKDVCPQTVAKLGRARMSARLKPEQLQIVMVSVDPARDTPAAMRKFFERLAVRAVGLTGSQPRMKAVYRAYGVAVEPQKDDIGHSDYIYLLDRQGRLRELLSSHAPFDAVAHDLRALVE